MTTTPTTCISPNAYQSLPLNEQQLVRFCKEIDPVLSVDNIKASIAEAIHGFSTTDDDDATLLILRREPNNDRSFLPLYRLHNISQPGTGPVNSPVQQPSRTI